MNCNMLQLGRLSLKKLQHNNVKLVALTSILQHIENDNEHIQRNVQNLKNTVKKVLVTTISTKSFDRRDKYCFSSFSFPFSRYSISGKVVESFLLAGIPPLWCMRIEESISGNPLAATIPKTNQQAKKNPHWTI